MKKVVACFVNGVLSSVCGCGKDCSPKDYSFISSNKNPKPEKKKNNGGISVGSFSCFCGGGIEKKNPVTRLTRSHYSDRVIPKQNRSTVRAPRIDVSESGVITAMLA